MAGCISGVAASIAEKADDVAARFRSGCLALAEPEPLSVFDHAYVEPHAELDRQRSQYEAYLKGFAS